MKHPRDDAGGVTSLSLSAGGLAERSKKPRRSGGDGGAHQFVCKTCSRAFASFQALGGHRTSHLRGRHGLALGIMAPAAKASATTKEKPAAASHQCHVCGVGFEMGQALGGHMRRHREEAAQAPPVLLQLFV